MLPRLVLLHGFTQTGRSWAAAGEALGKDFDVRQPDLPGHAGRPHDEASLWAVADTIASEHGRTTYVGYSMGARVALHLALAHPELVERLVLIGGTPGLRSDAERRDRRAADEELASKLESEGLEQFLDRWLANPLFAGLRPDAANREDRMRSTVQGLAASLRRCGTGMQDDLWPRLRELQMPVFLMAGALDTKFAAIAEEMSTYIGHAEVALVPGAGHTAHLEQPSAFLALLRNWLAGRS